MVSRKTLWTVASLLLAWLILGNVLLSPVAEASPAQQTAPTATILADRLNVRSGPGTTYKVVASAANGDKYAVTGQTSQCAWLKISSNGKALGWVSGNKAYVKLNTTCAKIPATTAPAAPAATAAGQGCATVINQLGFDVKISVQRNDGWKDAFTIANGAEKDYCVDPGTYTATLSATGRPGP